MEHIDYDTEYCLHAAPEPTSGDQIAMSVTSQRRLIRKPLPDLPPSQSTGVGSHSLAMARTVSSRQNAISLDESQRRAKQVAAAGQKELDWWPSTLPRDVEAGPSCPIKLNEHYRRHLRRLIGSCLDACGKSSQTLEAGMFDAIEQCLATLSTPDAMSALQRSQSFLWRVEALIRSYDQLGGSSKVQKRRWPGLGPWRGSISAGSSGQGTEARMRKRDVAIQLLGNAFWMAGVGIGDGAALDVGLDDNRVRIEGKVPQKRISGAAPALLVRTGLPTVALQRESGSAIEENTKSDETSTNEDAPDRASVLTTRLAMQLKKSEGTVRGQPPSRPRQSRGEDEGSMAVCKVCIDFIDESRPDRRKRRSGTITAHADRTLNASGGSTRSNCTIRPSENLYDEDCISWKAGIFKGSPLFLNPLSSEAEGRDQLHETKTDSRMHLIGGTFSINGSGSQEEEIAVRSVLDIALYAACAMLLEGALLYDLQVEEDAEEVQTTKADQKDDNTSKEAEQDRSPPLEANTRSDVPAEKTKWSIWGMLHYSSDHVASPTKRHTPGVPRVMSVELPSRKHKKQTGYSGRIGKMIDSFAGSKRSSTAEHTMQNDTTEPEIEAAKAEEQTSAPSPNAVDVEQQQQQQEEKPAPIAISPFYSLKSDEAKAEYSKEAYLEYLLSQQSLAVTVLEGLDVSLPLSRPTSDESVSQRAPALQVRPSFNDSESKGSGSTLIGTRPVLSSSGKSDRSTSTSYPAEISVKQSPTTSAVPGAAASVDGDEKNRREVQFYQRVGTSRDVSLGQAIEEMAAKATVLAKEAKGVHRVAHYLHGADRISIMANVAQSAESSSNPPDKADIQTIAKASQLGQDVVRSAVLLAEHLPESGDRDSNQHIKLWTANIKTGSESGVRQISEATYLASYGAFLEALLVHPKLAKDKYDEVRMFQIGNTTLKVQVQPIVVFDLLTEGPVVKTQSQQSGPKEERNNEMDKAAKKTRLEIQDFYASVKRHITALEHVIVARDLDANGCTIRPSKTSSRTSLSSILSVDESKDGLPLVASSTTGSTLPSTGALPLLAKLRKCFRRAEFELYDAVKAVRPSMINDIRARFFDRARSVKNRLSAWERKHLTEAETKRLEPLDYLEPEYFERGKYAFPGSRFIIREDEPLSIIAYTLSSREFDDELHRRKQKDADVMNWRNSVVANSITPSQLSLSNVSTASPADASTAASIRTELDPDQDEDFHTPEPLHVNMKRKKRVKDAGILSLTLRRVNSNISRSQSGTGNVEKESSHPTEASFDESSLATPTGSRIVAKKYDTVSSSNNTFSAQIAQVAPVSSLGSMFDANSTQPPTPADEKDDMSFSDTTSRDGRREVSDALTPTMAQSPFQRRVISQPIEGSSRMPASPHIKHTIVSGSLKISCISWFAEDFAKLRQKWGIDVDFIQSMSRCKSSTLMGGKSKSGFYLTHDGKWIAKQLLNIWSVDEKEAFLEFAPTYLRYMSNSVVNDCPTLLVKIAGVFTLKIKNMKTGETKLRMSVQVLENVFAHDESESIRFDLKGIRDRRVVPKKEQEAEEDKAPVWWDAEWLDCFQARAYVPEAHKSLFRQALRNDLAFLTASNVMDYSLLVGAHENDGSGAKEGADHLPQSTFRVRVVDFLGAFTLAKFIESSSKKAIKSQAPTIIPPHEYAARFAQTIESYFTPTPF